MDKVTYQLVLNVVTAALTSSKQRPSLICCCPLPILSMVQYQTLGRIGEGT